MTENRKKETLRNVLAKCKSGFRPLIDPDTANTKLDLAVRQYLREMYRANWPEIPNQEIMTIEDVFVKFEDQLAHTSPEHAITVMEITPSGPSRRIYLNLLLYLINKGHPAFLVGTSPDENAARTAVVAYGK